jgi:hypothetical protein
LALAGLMLAAVDVGRLRRDNPTAPATMSLSGRVRLTSFLVDGNGHFTGTRVVEDADSVDVELLLGQRSLGHTLTVGGAYRFAGLGPGAYKVAASVTGEIADRTPSLTLVDHDIVSGYTLVLTSLGDLFPSPNPSSDVVQVLFQVPDTELVTIRILDTQGRITQHLFSSVMEPGLRELLWNGRDDAGHLVTGQYYWITFESGSDRRAQLLFR